MYFKGQTIEELKKEYKTLCKKYHPDICKQENATEIMQEINAEYEEKIKTATQGNKDIINDLLNIDTLIIEIVGVFVWVSGDTRTHKEKLKALGYRYSINKKMWYYVLDKGLKYKRGTNRTIEQIKNKYGCRTVSNNKDKKKIA